MSLQLGSPMRAIVMLKQSGLSMIELVVTIVILAIALAIMTSALSGSLSRSTTAAIELQAVALAQAYLDEILGKRFDERTRTSGIPPCRATAPPARQCTAEGLFGPDGAETRARFDDIDDYHGLDEGDGQATPLQDANGVTRTGYENFRVAVDVRYINVGVGEEEFGLGVGSELNDQFDAKLVTLTVYYRGLTEGFKFSAYASNF